MRLVFAGTPAVALPSVEALAARHEIVAVLTRPPARQGRSSKLVASPVAQWADEHGVEILDPPIPRDPALAERLRDLAPDVCPVVAYGGLITDELLAIPPGGWVNLHFSSLPAYRGAAPVQRAILAGEDVLGLTTFRLVPELDAGPVLEQIQTPLGEHENSGEALDRLAGIGADLLVSSVERAAAGEPGEPQDTSGVSFAPKITVEEVAIDWSRPATEIDRLVRAAHPNPGAWTILDGARLKLAAVEVTDETLPPGRLDIRKREVLAGTGSTALRLLSVVPSGKKAMAGPDWARGLHVPEGGLTLSEPGGHV
ncbi:MAG: methionyl-tRNA formyltransferase [Propionibacteriaceae bacterium]|jgi:methionyl-tRNA formyltransferase|nr:methionyl-tRNA formyltransferase [Propionibacteriaceae bacterium]